MANSTFPIRIGARNGSNGGVVRALKSNRVPHGFAPRFWWYQRFVISSAGTLDADTDQEFDLHTYNANNLFPANVERTLPLVYLVTPFTGGLVSACTYEAGDANDPNGLHTAVSVFTGSGWLANTTGAAEYARRLEAAFIPSITIRTTTANVNALTAGTLWQVIGFNSIPGVS